LNGDLGFDLQVVGAHAVAVGGFQQAHVGRVGLPATPSANDQGSLEATQRQANQGARLKWNVFHWHGENFQ
jgi:hypothetical protein